MRQTRQTKLTAEHGRNQIKQYRSDDVIYRRLAIALTMALVMLGLLALVMLGLIYLAIAHG